MSKIVNEFHILLQLLESIIARPYRGSAPGSHWGLPSP